MPARKHPAHPKLPAPESEAAEAFSETLPPVPEQQQAQQPVQQEGLAEPTQKERSTRRYAGVRPTRGSFKKRDPAQNLIQASSLGSLEAELMGLLWEMGRPASGMDVMEASLYKRRGAGQEPVAFSSVTTTLRRLAGKGLLRVEKGEQRAALYTPTLEREQMAARILNSVSLTLLGRSLRGLLPRLVGSLPPDTHSFSPDEEAEVARLMRALEEAAGERATDRPE